MTTGFRDLLRRLGLEDFYDVLNANDIDETILSDLSDDDLRELGLTLGQRKRFSKAIQNAPSPARPAAERRQLTVVFCDLVGSTNLATALDVEDLREVMSTYHSVSQGIMKAHGGYLAYTQGDGLMVYFGYPVAHEDDAARAVRAALATAEAIANLETASPRPLEVRLGIATGIVVVGDMIGGDASQRDFVVGETPNLASRLQTLAEPSEVMIAQETRDLIGRGFECDHRGAPKMKGFPDGLNVYHVREESADQSRFDMATGEAMGPLIGREAELEAMTRHWAGAVAGEGRVCLVEGAAGIGKSRLARALMDQASVAEPITVNWQCASHLANRAMHPMTREIARAAGLRKDDSDEDNLARLSRFAEATAGLGPDDLPLLADFLDLASDEPVEQDPQARALMTQRVLMRWIQGLASQGPILLTMEDAHWADSLTQDFIAHLIDNLADLPVLLVVTFRPEFAPPWALPEDAHHIRLEPLDVEAGTRLIRQITGLRDLPQVVAREILQKTDGVPLFLEELTKVILETAADKNSIMDVSTLEMLVIPATLHDSLMARLDRIGSGKEVAQLGAVIGREFSAGMLSTIAPPGLDIRGGLDQLLAAGLIYPSADSDEQVFVFNHALVQDVAYDSILKSRRRESHRQLAQVMLSGDPAFGAPEPEIIARHCDVARMPQEAMEHWMAAGQHALSHANNLAAVTYLRAALRQLDALPETDQKAPIELGIQMMLAPACMAIYGWGSQEVEHTCARSRELAFDLGNHEALFGALWGLWTNYFLRGELEHAMATALETETMAQHAGVPMLATAADHAVGYTHFFRGELEPALERAERGLARYSDADELAIIQTFQFSSTVALRSFKAATLWLMGRTQEGETALAESLQFASDVNHRPSLAYGLGSAGQDLVLRKDWARLAEVAETCLSLSQDEGYILWERVAAVQLEIAKGKLGQSPDALDRIDAERGRFFATQTVLTDVLIYPAFADLMIEAGAHEMAITRLTKVISEAERRKEALNLPEVYRKRGEAHLAAGQEDKAERDFESALALANTQGAKQLADWAKKSLENLHNSRKVKQVL